MTKYFFALLFTGMLFAVTGKANVFPVDSVGTVVKNGKSYTVHKVTPKETFYALARQYNVPVAQIQQANPGVNALAVGQTIYVPGRKNNSIAGGNSADLATSDPVTASAAPTGGVPARTTVPATSGTGKNVHTVEARQTLYAIARLYNVSPADLKKWNNLATDNLQEGQSLIVVAPAMAEAPAEAVNTPAATPVRASGTEAKPASGAIVPAAAPVRTPVRREETTAEVPVKEERTETRYSETMSRVSESGLAEVMDQREEGKKYLALHKTAPVGTILQVRNTMNNQSVYVRVSGKLPDGPSTDKVIIKVSKRAYQKLAASDNRFRVEVNYMP